MFFPYLPLDLLMSITKPAVLLPPPKPLPLPPPKPLPLPLPNSPTLSPCTLTSPILPLLDPWPQAVGTAIQEYQKALDQELKRQLAQLKQSLPPPLLRRPTMTLEQFKLWVDGYLAPYGGDASLLNKADFTKILRKLDMEVEQTAARNSRGERYIEGPFGPEQPL